MRITVRNLFNFFKTEFIRQISVLLFWLTLREKQTNKLMLGKRSRKKISK